MSTETTARVLEALSSLYNSTGRQESREANQWLNLSRKSPRLGQSQTFFLNPKTLISKLDSLLLKHLSKRLHTTFEI
ncbi:unnamed protein product [Mucor hiemalis]